MPIHDWTAVPAGMFHHFHNAWIYKLAETLNGGLLPSGFFAAGEQVTGLVEPDVVTLSSMTPEGQGWEESPGVVALAERPPQVALHEASDAMRYERKRDRLTIWHVSGDRVVAVVEIVSPGNKSSRARWEAFLGKAVDFLEAGVHLLLIDLFPPGRFDPEGLHAALWDRLTGTPTTPLPADQRQFAAYAAGETVEAFIEPRGVGSPLPSAPLFLAPGWYIPLPLEETYIATWQAYPEPWRKRL